MVTVGMYPCLSVTRSFMLAEGASAVGVSGCLWVTLCHSDHCFCCIILCNNELERPNLFRDGKTSDPKC